MATEQTAPAFDVTEGDWRVTGDYSDTDNITFYYRGELFRSITFPAYKIWNVPAHLDEYIAELERLRAEAELDRVLARARDSAIETLDAAVDVEGHLAELKRTVHDSNDH